MTTFSRKSTRYSTKDLLSSERLLHGLISGNSLFDTAKLEAIIAEKVTPELLDKIAAEYRKGRMLLVGTTDLDAGRPVIWNMGAIAASGAPGALASLPPGDPRLGLDPCRLPARADRCHAPDGTVYDEMHVDGGATSQVTFVSPDVPIRMVTIEALGAISTGTSI